MIYCYNGTKVFYEFHNGDKDPIILLHGWGGSGKVFDGIINAFKDKSFLTIDFPPFGESGKIKDWTIFTYANMVISLCEHLKIESADFLAHSFGGRVVLILSVVKCSLVHSLILADSAGMKPKRKLVYYFKVYFYKFLKHFKLNTSNCGSQDYLALDENMKKVFKNIISTHLEDFARASLTKTLLVWGENDDDTPLYMGKRLHKLIKNSQFFVIKDAGHYSFLDKPFVFYKIINKFWSEL